MPQPTQATCRSRQGQAVAVHRSRRQDPVDVQHVDRQRHPYEAVNKNDRPRSSQAMQTRRLFKTTRERPEGWWEGDLGKIYRRSTSWVESLFTA